MRGRGLAVYLMVFNGALAGGSLLWGLVAQQAGVVATLVIAAAALMLSALLLRRKALPQGEADLQPALHWQEPAVAQSIDGRRGPVMVQIHYRVAEEDRPAFLAAINKLALARRRDGAYAWGVMTHTEDAAFIQEWFLVESWQEHLRQHQRVSKADAELQAAVLAFHQGEGAPKAHHFISL